MGRLSDKIEGYIEEKSGTKTEYESDRKEDS